MTRSAAGCDPAFVLAQIQQEDAAVMVRAKGAGYDRIKRILDVVLAFVLIVLLWPLMLLIAATIKLTSRGPAIFTQQRTGLHGKPFKMYKFRTMRKGAEDDRAFLAHKNETNGPVFKIADDPRLTKVGKLLRRSSMDELPQLFNALAGNMSLVGPRPLWFVESQQITGPV